MHYYYTYNAVERDTTLLFTIMLQGGLQLTTVPHSKSGVVPMSSLSGIGQLGFWEVGKGGTNG